MVGRRKSSEGIAAIWPVGAPGQDEFARRVREEGTAHARAELPWRYIDDPYAVLVSEVMLQQTQVKRVLTFWPRFLEAFPTLESLAGAPTAHVLELWQGLGYNRRALSLKKAVEQVVDNGEADLPGTYEDLVALPGIGPATAAGVQAFARNLPGVYLETNVRTVFLHELYPGETGVSDKVLEPVVALTCPHDDPREWYYNLLDYGAYLKTQVVNPSRRSANYARQSKFEGSRRQKRSELVRIVLDEPGIELDSAFLRLNDVEREANRPEVPRSLFDSIVADLSTEGFFQIRGQVLVP